MERFDIIYRNIEIYVLKISLFPISDKIALQFRKKKVVYIAGTNVALPANCGKSIKLNTSSSVTLTYRNENGSVDDCSYVFTQDDVTRQICVTVVTPSSDIDCNLRIQWHTGAETFAFYSHQVRQRNGRVIDLRNTDLYG